MLWLNHVHITYFMKLGICSFKCEHFNRPKMKRKILKNCLNLKMLKIVKSFFVRMLFVCGKIFKDIHVWAFFLFLSPSLSTFTQHSYNASFMNQYFCHECEFFTFFSSEAMAVNGGVEKEKNFFFGNWTCTHFLVRYSIYIHMRVSDVQFSKGERRKKIGVL